MHLLLMGILLGMGAAIPIGPVNLEIIRRNLRFGTAYGIVTGLGACSADITYLFLLCVGALALLQYPTVLQILGLIGSFILIWFAINAFRAQPTEKTETTKLPSLTRYGIEGYIITMINPYTVLFWASISSQISLSALTSQNALLLTGLGVVIGTVGWVLTLNSLIHFSRHKLTITTIKWLNYTGGIILLGFAISGLYKTIWLLKV
jgi:L-lysine exporter family protein LysE/ArgO